jgi:L-phenylalanine/L-methionine N-acetyltransferase
VRDAAAIVAFMAEPSVLANLMQLPYPSVEKWEKMLADNDAPGRTDLHLVAERQGVVIGSAGLHPAGAALRRRHVAMLGISVAAAHQGSGVGAALMQALTDYADRWGQILRIELTVFADNARAIALYERFGFEHEGRLRAYALRDGRYEDVLAMGRLHPNPPALR